MKKAKRRAHTYILVLYLVYNTWYIASYLVLLYVRYTAHRSTTQHRTSRQGAAPHGTVRRRVELLSGCTAEPIVHFLRFNNAVRKPRVCSITSTGTRYDIIIRMIPGMYERVSTTKHAARHSTVPHRTAGHGTAWHRAALRC